MNNVIFKKKYFLWILLIDLVALPVTTGQAPIINVAYDNIHKRIFRIESMVNAQGKVIYEMQQQLNNIQHYIEILKGKIEENEHNNSDVLYKYQKDINLQLNIIKKYLNNKQINDNSFISEIYKTTYKLIKEKEIYDVATTLAINSKNNKQISNAIILFKYLINNYNNSNHQSNFLYWLGQLNYKIGNKDEAAFYYATFIKKYPNSQKIPNFLYKIGLLMQEKGQTNNAKIAYQKVIESYPNTLSAKLAKKKLLNL